MAYQPSADEKKTGMICHILAITTWLGPLIMYLVKKDEKSPFVKLQIKQTLAWGVAVAIVLVALWAVTLALPFLFFLYSLVWLANAVFVVLAGLKTNKGEKFVYPVVAEMFVKDDIAAVWGDGAAVQPAATRQAPPKA